MTVVELLSSGPVPWLDPELRAALFGVSPSADRCDEVTSTVPSPGPPPGQQQQQQQEPRTGQCLEEGEGGLLQVGSGRSRKRGNIKFYCWVPVATDSVNSHSIDIILTFEGYFVV